MLLSLYPNGELRARFAAAPLKGRRRQKGDRAVVSSSSLSIVAKLRSEIESPFREARSASLGRVGYGIKPRLTEFGPRARRKIARAGGLLSGEDSRQRTLFLTGTLPGGTQRALEAISCHSAWVVHELLTHIPRMAGVLPSQCRFLWVWEWQKRGALHWHGVFQFPSRDDAKKALDGFFGLWVRVLESIGRRSGTDIAARLDGGTHAHEYDKWRTKAEWARKNPSRYLAKYVSKANKSSKFCEGFPPTRWYGLSRSLHDELLQNTVVTSTSYATGIPDHKIAEKYDLPLIERFFGLSHLVRDFSDKIRDGHTFVFYISECNLDEVRGILGEIASIRTKGTRNMTEDVKHRFYYLSKVQGYPVLLERFLNDAGSRLREVFERCKQGDECDFEDLVLLDRTAWRVLDFAGLAAQVNPPKEAKRGLTGQSPDRLEGGTPPEPDWTQNSLLP